MPQTAKDLEDPIPWRAIAGIGNVIRHDYHDTYPTVLWETCSKDLLPLKSALARMRAAVAIQDQRQ